MSTINQAIIKTLEYTTVEYAAELLGCDKRAIIHWAATRKIDLQIWLNDAEAINVYLKDDGGLPLLEGGLVLMRNGSKAHVYDLDSDWATGYVAAHARLSGRWCVNEGVFQSMELNTPISGGVGLFAQGIEEIGDRWWSFTLVDPLPSTAAFFISGEHLHKLSSAIGISNPKPLERVNRLSADAMMIDPAKLPKPQDKVAQPPRPHHKEEAAAVKREQVLAAALRAIVNNEWRDEGHDTARALAQKVINHEHLLFEGGECPLSAETTERLISTAITTGRIKKRT